MQRGPYRLLQDRGDAVLSGFLSFRYHLRRRAVNANQELSRHQHRALQGPLQFSHVSGCSRSVTV
jgi:hypothetical protein